MWLYAGTSEAGNACSEEGGTFATEVSRLVGFEGGTASGYRDTPDECATEGPVSVVFGRRCDECATEVSRSVGFEVGLFH